MGYLLLLLTEWGIEMMKRMITAAAMLVVLMALLGCGSSVQVAPPPERTVSDNNNIECAVFFDGSMSMQGFVNFPVATEYVDAINNIEQTLTLGWKNENITYYRFGDRIQKIDARDRLMFARSGFYSDLLTQLDEIVHATNNRNLNIIVSDFLQTDQDFQKLVTAIKADYLCNGRGAALIGVKSRFKGYVYDVGLNKEQFYYSSGEEQKNFRPFYLLVLGEQRSVEKFCSYYKQGLANAIDYKLICWIDDLGAGKLETAAVDYKQLAGIKTYAAVDDILAMGAEVPQYELQERQGSVYLLYRLPQSQLLGQELEVKCHYELWNNEDHKFRRTFSELVASSEAEVRSEGVSLRLDLQPGVLQSGGVYRVGLLLQPDSDIYKKLQLSKLDDWKMEDSFEVGGKGSFAIDTMLDIKKFIRNLSDVAYVNLHPHYQEVYVYCRY